MPAIRDCAVSIVLAPLLDGSRQSLHIAHRSTRAWQLADRSGRVVACMLLRGGVRLPHAVVVASLPSGSPSISVGAGAWMLDGAKLPVTRWWTPRRPRLPQLVEHIDDAAARALARSWRLRLGRGDGLTPYGDDVVCGALVTLVAADHPAAAQFADAVVAADLEASTTAVSAALLRQAAAGRCIDELAAYLTARAGRPGQVQASEAALTAVGHSSGAGMVEGVRRMIGRAEDATPGVAA